MKKILVLFLFVFVSIAANGALVIAPATNQPPSSLPAVSGAERIPYTRLVLTAAGASAHVDGLIVQHVGFAQNAIFTGVVLLDENFNYIGVPHGLNVNRQAVIGEPFDIPVGVSKTVIVAGNMSPVWTLIQYAGQVSGLSVVGVNSPDTVSGELPITGAMHTVNASLSIGAASAYLSAYDPAENSLRTVGTESYRFSGIKIVAGSAEDLTLHSVIFTQSGTADEGDVNNVKVVVDGVEYPTVQSKRRYSANFPNGIVIGRGFSKDIYIKGDISVLAIVGRTVEFDVADASDVYLAGNTYGFGVQVWANSTGTLTSTSRSKFTAGTPFYGGSVLTIDGPSLGVQNNPVSVPSQNIAVGVSNQPLGAYDVIVKGQPVSVDRMVFHLKSSSSHTTRVVTSISLINENGVVVAGPVDAHGVNASDGSAGASADQVVIFTDTVIYPVGVSTYRLVGKLPAGATGYTMDSTVIVSTKPIADWTGALSFWTGDSVSLTAENVVMSTITVKLAALAVRTSSFPPPTTVLAGSRDFTWSSIELDATQSSEDVWVAAVPMHLTYTAGVGTDISGCRLFDLFNGTTPLTTGSNVINPGNQASPAPYTFVLDQALVVPKGTVKHILVKCSATASATNFVGHWDMTATDVSNLQVGGVASGVSVAATGFAIGPAMTVRPASPATDSPVLKNFRYLGANAQCEVYNALVGQLYSIESTTDLKQWRANGSSFRAVAESFTEQFPVSGGPNQFFRFVLVQP